MVHSDDHGRAFFGGGKTRKLMTDNRDIQREEFLEQFGSKKSLCPDLTNLYQNYSRALRLFVLTMVKSEQIAEEIAQESYLRILKVRNKEKIENPKAYLFRTASNLSKDFLRRRALRVIDGDIDAEDDRIAPDSPSPEELLIYNQTKEKLELLLMTIPLKARQVFYLRRYEGRSMTFIADELNISERMVYKHMRNALQILANGLNRKYP